VETRPGKRPQLSDLRESGAIEQDADIVSFIFRPEYYKITVWDNDEEGQETSTENQAELIIAKHRNGATADVRLSFLKHFAKFGDIEAAFDGGMSGGGYPSTLESPNQAVLIKLKQPFSQVQHLIFRTVQNFQDLQ
jgi:replicative DNA helicase